MPKTIQSDRDTWPEAMATVTACKYEFGAGRALAFGLPTTRHFRITYNYWAPNADGTPELHTGELTSAKAMPQAHSSPSTTTPKRLTKPPTPPPRPR